MNISVETQNVDLSPEWRRKVEQKLDDWSDPRDPIISARSTISFKSGETPPAAVSLIVNLRGKNIVINKRGETVDVVLKNVLDTAKREIREFYKLRSDYRSHNAPAREVESMAVETLPADLDEFD